VTHHSDLSFPLSTFQYKREGSSPCALSLSVSLSASAELYSCSAFPIHEDITETHPCFSVDGEISSALPLPPTESFQILALITHTNLINSCFLLLFLKLTFFARHIVLISYPNVPGPFIPCYILSSRLYPSLSLSYYIPCMINTSSFAWILRSAVPCYLVIDRHTTAA